MSAENETLVLAPTSNPRQFRAPDGRLLAPPAGWECLPPGDAGLTRRVKQAGPSWQVLEKRGRKLFSRGLWAPAEHIAAAKNALATERATPQYAQRRAADARRRQREQGEYEEDFTSAVLRFLAFSRVYEEQARKLAAAIARHATPVGSGTVARTERIPLERRAEAATLAWMRHQTTNYDNLSIARVKGARRETRRHLAEVSRALLDLHRQDQRHAVAGCPLCTAISS